MSGFGYLAICMGMWGLALFGMKLAGQKLDPITIAGFNMFGYLLVGAFVLPRASFELTRYHLVAVAVAAMFVVGNMAFYKLSQSSAVSTLAPVTALYIIIPIVLGIVFLREPLTWQKGAGIALALVAIYLLSLPDNS